MFCSMSTRNYDTGKTWPVHITFDILVTEAYTSEHIFGTTIRDIGILFKNISKTAVCIVYQDSLAMYQ